MSNTWLLLSLVIISIIALAPQCTLAKDATPVGSDVNGGSNISKTIAAVPLALIRGILNVPLSIFSSILVWLGGVSGAVAETMISKMWDVTKNSVLPGLDKLSMQMSTWETFPEDMRKTINSAHSIYGIIKMFGYLRPQ